MSRAYPVPLDVERTIHFVGDVHVGSLTLNRQNELRNDLLRPSVPSIAYHIQTGDMIDLPTGTQDADAVALMDSIGGDWHAVVGNHDMWGSVRTAEDAALAWGMPGANYVLDYGYTVLICVGPTVLGADNGSMSFDVEWINTQLGIYSDRLCMIVAHPPLSETVGKNIGINSNQWTSIDPAFHVYNDTAMRTMLADNPNSKAWICGHTHSKLSVDHIVMRDQVMPGSHYLAHINTSCINYTTKSGQMWNDQIATPFVTVYDNEVQVRYRDHARGQWVGSGPDLIKAWKIAV